MKNNGTLLFAEGNNERLFEDLEKLEHNYYDVIIALGAIVSGLAAELKEHEMAIGPLQYISLCNEAVEKITRELVTKKKHLVPYLRKLSEKEASDHDCRNCNSGGACNLNHNIQLNELKESNKEIKDILNRLEFAGAPQYSDITHADTYELLFGQMTLFMDRVSELLFIEETYIIPKVSEMQKNIHAGT